MKCICGDKFFQEKDIPTEHNRCPNCDRNIYDINNAKHTEKVKSLIKEFIKEAEDTIYSQHSWVLPWITKFKEVINENL